MKKIIFISVTLGFLFLLQGYTSIDLWGVNEAASDINILQPENAIKDGANRNSVQQKGQRIWGNVGTVVLGYDPAEEKTLVYATQLPSGDIYQYTPTWARIGGPGAMFVADQAGHLYGLATDKSAVYEYTGAPGRWNKIGGASKSIYAGANRLYAENPQTGDLYEYLRELGRWQRIGGPGAMYAADHTGNMYGLAPDKSGVYLYTGTPGKWEKIGGPATSIYAGGDKLYASSPASGNIHVYSHDTAKWSDLGKGSESVAIDFRGRLFGLTADGNELLMFERTGDHKKIGGPTASRIFPAIFNIYILDSAQELFAVPAPTHYPSAAIDDTKTDRPPTVSQPSIQQAEGYVNAIPLPTGPPPELDQSEYYKITSKLNGYCLYVHEGKDGAPISAVKSHAGDGQRWKFSEIFEEHFRIRAKQGGHSLTNSTAEKDQKFPAVVSEWTQADNQLWRLAQVGDGYFAILSKADDRCLDIESKKENYLEPTAWIYKDSQLWKFAIPKGEDCEQVSIEIVSFYIAKADDFGTFGEPGDSAEWELSILINGGGQVWSSDNVRDDMMVDHDWWSTIVSLNDVPSIQIAAAGIEKDSIGDDQLPAAHVLHTAADNWGIGPPRELVGKNKDFHYVITYLIRCIK